MSLGISLYCMFNIGRFAFMSSVNLLCSVFSATLHRVLRHCYVVDFVEKRFFFGFRKCNDFGWMLWRCQVVLSS